LEKVEPFGSDLFKLLNHRDHPSVFVLITVIVQMCEALGFLRKRDVVHGDLKGENVLVSSWADASNTSIKVIDFGQAAVVGKKQSWPGNINIPPSYRRRILPAQFSQDLFGVGFILTQYRWVDNFKKEVPQAAATQARLKEVDDARRMTLDELEQEPWIKDFSRRRAGSKTSASTISTCDSRRATITSTPPQDFSRRRVGSKTCTSTITSTTTVGGATSSGLALTARDPTGSSGGTITWSSLGSRGGAQP
jgi:hypothetical protein